MTSQSGLELPTTTERARREELAAQYEAHADLIESATGVHDEFKRTAARDLRARARALRENAK